MTAPLRVAVVGVGRWGRNLASSLGKIPSCRLVALCDSDAERVQQVGEELGVERRSLQYDEMVGAHDIDAIVLSTPPETHAEMARQAVEAGKHVFVEKPLATSLADGLLLERSATHTGRLVMAGHLLRYHDGLAALRKLIVRGDIGDVLWAVSRRLGWRSADRCGPWWSLAPHDLCVLRGIFGGEPKRIAAAAALSPPSSRNPVRALLGGGGSIPPPSQVRSPVRVVAATEFEGPIPALIDVGLLDESKMRKVVVVGSLAVARFEDGIDGGIWLKELPRTPSLPMLPSKDEPFSVEQADELLAKVDDLCNRGGVWIQTTAKWDNPLYEEMHRFVAACGDPRIARVEMDDALAILRALEAGSRSMREGGRCLVVPGPARHESSTWEISAR